MTYEEMITTVKALDNEKLLDSYDESRRVNIFECEKPWGLTKDEFAKLRVALRKEILGRMSK